VGARELLANDCTVASVACRAIDEVLGEVWRLWEPETLWLELHRRGIEVPVGNRQQIMAGRVLLNTDRATYDALVFAHTSTAFSNDLCDYEGLDEDFVGRHAWCVNEMRAIYAQANEPMPSIDREVVSFVALALKREGFVLAPVGLEFAQDALDALYGPSTRELKKAVQEIWASSQGLAVRHIAYPETPRGVQMARLASVEAFLNERRTERTRQAAQLG